MVGICIMWGLAGSSQQALAADADVPDEDLVIVENTEPAQGSAGNAVFLVVVFIETALIGFFGTEIAFDQMEQQEQAETLRQFEEQLHEDVDLTLEAADLLVLRAQEIVDEMERTDAELDRIERELDERWEQLMRERENDLIPADAILQGDQGAGVEEELVEEVASAEEVAEESVEEVAEEVAIEEEVFFEEEYILEGEELFADAMP